MNITNKILLPKGWKVCSEFVYLKNTYLPGLIYCRSRKLEIRIYWKTRAATARGRAPRDVWTILYFDPPTGKGWRQRLIDAAIHAAKEVV
jgi:hypothetical protein